MKINREYKATLFSELFSKPQQLRELYNALAGTNYDNETPIEINTLENVFFNDLKNDVSFTIDGKYVVLLEHQSTVNSNMPLRCLMYIARVYEKITAERAIYQEKQLSIPIPEFIVLYNGVKPFPKEKILRLSESYITDDKITDKPVSLDLSVRVLNINPGYNDELMQKSVTLNDYSVFIDHVRQKQHGGSSLYEAVKEAISWGMNRGILGTFLMEHGSEVSSMLMTEFNIDIAKEVWQEEAREDAYEEFKDQLAEKDAELADKDAEIARMEALIKELQAKIE